MRHVHIGAGALGLGLIVPATAPDLDLTIVQRRSSRSAGLVDALTEHRNYYLHLHSPDSAPSTSQIALSPGSDIVEAADTDRWGSVARDPETVLLTTSLGETALEQLTPALDEILSARVHRPGVPPLAVMACENRVGPAFAALAERFAGSSVEFLPSVVDRICIRPEVRAGEVHAVAEVYGSWLVPDHPAAAFLAGLPAADGVLEVVRDMDAMRRKKRWLVNTPHFTLGLHAWQHGVPFIDDFVRNEGAAVLARIQDECLYALMAYTDRFELAELRNFNSVVADRMASIHMPTDVVLRRLRPESSATLAATAQELLVEPARRLASDEDTPPPGLTQAMRILDSAVAASPPLGR